METGCFFARLLVSAAIIGMMFHLDLRAYGGYLYFGGASPRAYSPENLLRLHVLNSNSPEDQRVNLVRCCPEGPGRLFNGVATVDEAKAILEENARPSRKTTADFGQQATAIRR